MARGVDRRTTPAQKRSFLATLPLHGGENITTGAPSRLVPSERRRGVAPRRGPSGSRARPKRREMREHRPAQHLDVLDSVAAE